MYGTVYGYTVRYGNMAYNSIYTILNHIYDLKMEIRRISTSLVPMPYRHFIIEACDMPGTVVGCHLLCLGSCLARGVVLQLFEQTYHRLLQHFGTSITNAYSTHFVKSSGLNAKAKFNSSITLPEGVIWAKTKG